jgi:hypothetical protein
MARSNLLWELKKRNVDTNALFTSDKAAVAARVWTVICSEQQHQGGGGQQQEVVISGIINTHQLDKPDDRLNDDQSPSLGGDAVIDVALPTRSGVGVVLNGQVLYFCTLNTTFVR